MKNLMSRVNTIVLNMCIVVLLAACGGGGDDGPQTIISATTTASEPDVANLFRDDVTRALASPPSAATTTGDARFRACVRGVWRQTLRSSATLRLSLSVYGQPVRTIDNIAGQQGPDNRIEFSGCSEIATRTSSPTPHRASASITVRAMDNRGGILDGYDVSVDWSVVQL